MFHIGGPAKFLVRIHSVDELAEALDFAAQDNLAILILGGGSNVLARDEGFGGLVIQIAISGIEFSGATVVAGAGVVWDVLVVQAVAHGLWGLENLSGIPGSVGGAMVGGIGAYGASVGQHLAWVEAYDTQSRSVKKFTNAQCVFGYRDSIFKHRPELVVLRAAFSLSANRAPDLSYKDLAERFAGKAPALSEVREAVLAIRQGKFPDVAVEGTAGSFFKNPIVGEAEAHALRERYPGLPLFAMPEARGSKVPLAWLLDHVLNMKGLAVGGARLFEKQPLVIAARGGATAHDVRALALRVKKEVKEKILLEIQEEVVVL